MPQNRPYSKNSPSLYEHPQQGFTLVELLVVMLVLVALASITIETSKDFVFQQRYEVTKDRYAKIKKAIIGNPNQVINGQPNIEGFVKDMGRLPLNIHELLVQNYCDNDYRISDNTPDATGISGATGTTPESWCTTKTSAGSWVAQSNNSDCSDNIQTNQSNCEGAGKIWTGWKGAYIESKQPDYKPNALPDGWANSAKNLTDQNYGWNFINNTPNLTLNSFGKDGIIGVGVDDYDKDYPSTNNLAINKNDWKLDISPLKFLINIPYSGSCNPSSCSNSIYTTETDCTTNIGVWGTFTCSNPAYTLEADCTGSWQIYNAKPNCELSGKSWVTDTKQICLHIKDINGTLLSNSSSPVTISADGYHHQINFSMTTNELAQGKVSLNLYEYDGSDCATIGTPFGIGSIELILHANITLPTINW